ncbi:hypothetical protein NDN08_006421 [Rhodosorus marinus]|uniref:Brl1/Brr6 domain-containing protein n=1 Tax=Rhodosorus marinus TaxID=101924 RepID=A0AAV8UNS5_9RHOD|nr:hypothetical protein NDN08_006421 [Rhodosorus marinus]
MAGRVEPMDVDREIVSETFDEAVDEDMEVFNMSPVEARTMTHVNAPMRTSPHLHSGDVVKIVRTPKRGGQSSRLRKAMAARRRHQAESARSETRPKLKTPDSAENRRGSLSEDSPQYGTYPRKSPYGAYGQAESDAVPSYADPLKPDSSAVDVATRHQQMIVVLAGYLQLVFNLVLVSVILYSLISFAMSVRQDIQLKVNEEIADIRTDIERCRFNFFENRCNDEDRIVPRMREQCSEWASCLGRDPANAAYQTRLTAELIAEVVNSFIEPISYKTMVFTIGITIAFTVISNLAFYMARSKSSPIAPLQIEHIATSERFSEAASNRTPKAPGSSRKERYDGFHASGTPRRLEFYETN